MKLTLSLTFLFVICIHSLTVAQSTSPRAITEEDSVRIEMTIANEIEQLEDSLRSLDRFYIDKEFIEFTADTFAIEQRRKMKMDINWSTVGMNNATYDAEKEYDHLLNKYYQRLMGKLKQEDREILRKSQRNWIAFRDSEHEVNQMLSNWEYSGGGTIQTTISAGYYLEITRRRLIEIYRYLGRIR